MLRLLVAVIVVRMNEYIHQGGQTGVHRIPTFEETFETEEEAIEFGFAEGKKLIDSGQLPQLTN